MLKCKKHTFNAVGEMPAALDLISTRVGAWNPTHPGANKIKCRSQTGRLSDGCKERGPGPRLGGSSSFTLGFQVLVAQSGQLGDIFFGVVTRV